MKKWSAHTPGEQSPRLSPAGATPTDGGPNAPNSHRRHDAKGAVLVTVDRPEALGRQGRCQHRARMVSLPGWGRRVAPIVATIAMSLIATGCSDPAPSAGGSAPTTPALSAPPQSANGAAERQAVAAWQGMWQAYAKAGLTANPDEPDLARYASDRALTTLKNGLKSYRDKGQILKGDVVTNPQVSTVSPEVNPTTVTITDCVDDSKFLVYKASGELLNDVPGGRRSATATVTNVDAGGWKVSSFGVQEVDTC